MKPFFICLALLVAFQLPARQKKPAPVVMPTSRSFQADGSKIWTPAIQAIVRHQFTPTLVDKDSGTAAFQFSGGEVRGFDVSHAMQIWAVKPKGWLAIWSAFRIGGATMSAKPEGQSCKVSLSLDMSGFESNVQKAWIKLRTNGALESSIFDEVMAAVREASANR